MAALLARVASPVTDAGQAALALPQPQPQPQPQPEPEPSSGLRYGPLKFDWAWNHKGARKLHVGLA